MSVLLEPNNQVKSDVTYQVLKVSDNKIKIVLHWNQTPSSGYKIRIENVEVEGNDIKIVYKKYQPNTDSINCQVITKPSDSWEGTVDGAHDEYRVTLLNQ